MTPQQVTLTAHWLQRQAQREAIRQADQRSGRALRVRATTVRPPVWRQQPRDGRGRWCLPSAGVAQARRQA